MEDRLEDPERFREDLGMDLGVNLVTIWGSIWESILGVDLGVDLGFKSYKKTMICKAYTVTRNNGLITAIEFCYHKWF